MKIFLSAVTGQFGPLRNALAHDLKKAGADPVFQEDWPQHDGTVLEKLQKQVDLCDRVVIIVGTAYGAEPSGEMRPPAKDRRSYTQWEYYFAVGERLVGPDAPRKPMYLYLARDDFTDAHPFSPGQTDDQTKLQADFYAKLDSGIRDRTKFSTEDQLCRYVLHDLFKVEVSRPRPGNLPFESLGTLFKGREPFLADLRQRLTGTAAGPVAIVAKQAIHGLGGIGKTRVAIEYAWRFGGDYSALLFVSAPDPSSLRSNLANLVGVLAVDVAGIDTATEEQQLTAVLAWLRKNPRWLLILDNVDTLEAAQETRNLLAKLSGGDLLITSRISNWPAGVQALELHVLTPDDAVEYLLERTDHRRPKADDETQARIIAKELDGLALALEQAGAYINERRLTFVEYLTDWKARRNEVLDWHEPDSMTYPASLAVTWVTTFERLGDPERSLLQVLAHLAPEPIPLTFFEAEPLRSAIGDPRKALAGLLRYSLVRVSAESDAVEVHRLVQQITRARADQAEQAKGLRVALDAVARLAPNETSDVRNWASWLPMSAHAEVVAWEADGARIAEPTSRLMNQQSRFLRARGRFGLAEPLSRRALAIAEATLGPDHFEVASRLSNLGSLLRLTNRLAEAEPLYRRAVAIDEASFGPDSSKLAIRLSNLAMLLQATNRMDEAEPMIRRAIAIAEATNGPNHPEVAIKLDNLGSLLRATNRTYEAELLIRRALVIDESYYGPDHPKVATRLNYLTLLYQATDRHVEAEPLIRRALTIDEASYGSEHPTIARDFNTLALTLKATNRPAEAESLFCRALAIDEASFGVDHPNVARELSNLASLYSATNRITEALPLYHRALIIFIEFQNQNGHEHPEFGKCVENYKCNLIHFKLSTAEINQRIAGLYQESDDHVA